METLEHSSTCCVELVVVVWVLSHIKDKGCCSTVSRELCVNNKRRDSLKNILLSCCVSSVDGVDDGL